MPWTRQHPLKPPPPSPLLTSCLSRPVRSLVSLRPLRVRCTVGRAAVVPLDQSGAPRAEAAAAPLSRVTRRVRGSSREPPPPPPPLTPRLDSCPVMACLSPFLGCCLLNNGIGPSVSAPEALCPDHSTSKQLLKACPLPPLHPCSSSGCSTGRCTTGAIWPGLVALGRRLQQGLHRAGAPRALGQRLVRCPRKRQRLWRDLPGRHLCLPRSQQHPWRQQPHRCRGEG